MRVATWDSQAETKIASLRDCSEPHTGPRLFTGVQSFVLQARPALLLSACLSAKRIEKEMEKPQVEHHPHKAAQAWDCLQVSTRSTSAVLIRSCSCGRIEMVHRHIRSWKRMPQLPSRYNSERPKAVRLTKGALCAEYSNKQYAGAATYYILLYILGVQLPTFANLAYYALLVAFNLRAPCISETT